MSVGLTNLEQQTVNLTYVGSPDNDFAVVPVLSASGLYAVGDALGTLMTLTDIAAANGRSVIVQNAILYDLAEQTFTAVLYIFNANPSGSTITDKDPINVVDADAPKLVAKINFTNFDDAGGFKFAQGDDRSILAIPLDASRILYAALKILSGTPTLGTGEISLVLNLIKSY